MPYLWSLVVALAAVLALGALGLGLRGPVGRVTSARSELSRDLGVRLAVLNARLAAVHARRAQRRADPPTIEMARSDRGSTL